MIAVAVVTAALVVGEPAGRYLFALYLWLRSRRGQALPMISQAVIVSNRWPKAYWLMGFGIVQSGLLVTATINIHHFVVDAFIWRLKRDLNYQTVMDAPPSMAAG